VRLLTFPLRQTKNHQGAVNMMIPGRVRGAGGGLCLALAATLAVAAPAPPEKLEERATLKGHGDIVVGLAFSPDGTLLASAGRGDGTMRLWDVATGKCLRVIKGHGTDSSGNPQMVSAVAFSPHGKMVASAGDDLTVRLWDVATGECTAALRVQ